MLSNFLKSGLVKTVWINADVKSIYKVFKKLGIYNLFLKQNIKIWKALLEYQIAFKIISKNNISKRLEQNDKYYNNIEYQQTSFIIF
ncbi:hypothetical protein [Mycoplasma phocimorsus]|uniref:Uncharacterized protein n=1 Tax=Mycoplasma phocimorsus TaxID=3045839 RepID=A0AAJ1UWP5_9MOLU|nr:hypothetical protein [Mycoplasma phocimorsus]MDJ1645852.1 hypothetical protein [Mycoplasma phocimorsus]MDJ1647019.1 hypothetical protein [Mycoplasma phocimorsus]MDJ1648002.1 hypothetical protein [Mycoplasma phocimorsus]